MTEKLGEGTYGTVYKCYDVKKQTVVAVKKLKFHHEDQGIPATSVREIGILRSMNHENLVFLKDIARDDVEKNSLYLSFEMVDMDLNTFIKNRNRSVPIFEIKKIMFQIIRGVDHLHENRIFHRDLKPDNVLVSENLSKVKLADFGLSRTVHQPFRPMSREIMTLWYRSPESCMGYKEYSIGVDCWAIGCIFAQLVNGRSLLQGSSDAEQLILIFKLFGTPDLETWTDLEKYKGYSMQFPKFTKIGLKNKINHRLDATGLDLMEKFFELDPLKRITCKQALEHPWFSELNNCFK